MIDDNLLVSRLQSLAGMKNPVRLILFTRDIGCETCPEMVELGKAIKARSPKIALEIYDLVMDRDKSELYAVHDVPAFVVQRGDGRLVRFYGLMESVFQRVLLDTIMAASEGRTWFPDDIRRTLSHLEHVVPVQVFVESDCLQCRPVAETAIGLAFESDLVSVDIVVTSGFPKLIQKYAIKTLPKTVFGANIHVDGHVTETEFLEMIFQAEGLQPGPDRRCLVCGNPSPDMICGSCKNRIQAEAIDHKRKGERLKQADTP